MEAQARLAFQGLEAACASTTDVVELMTFHTGLRGEISEFVKVKEELIPDRYPSWSAGGATHLTMLELWLEIRAVAVAGCGG